MAQKLTIMLTTAALGIAAIASPTAVSAQRWRGDRYEQAYGQGYGDRDGPPPRDRRGWRDRGYPGRGYQDRSGYRDRGYRQHRCDSGTTGTIVGAIAGGLLGRSIDTRGDRSLGTILGAGGGALAGRAAERSGNPGWCR